MEILEFELSGTTAFFKKTDINSNFYATYSCIHKIALLGILGAVIGYSGYNSQGKTKYPEFYEKLKDIKCSIEIDSPTEIRKKIQTFNNSVGYASYENGNNLIVKEQWLENPNWTIRILVDEVVEQTGLKEKLLAGKCSFIPYLGKNDHFANISQVKILEGNKVNTLEKIDKITGLYPDGLFDIYDLSRKTYVTTMDLPIKFKTNTLMYEQEKFTQTNGSLKLNRNFEITTECIFVEINSKTYSFM